MTRPNEQYVPIGYRSTGYTTPTPSNMVVTSKPTSTSTSESSKLTTTQLIMVVLTLTVGATTSLVFYFRKRTKIEKIRGPAVSTYYFLHS